MSRAKLSPHQGVVPAIVWASRSAASKVTDCESSVKPLSSGHVPTVAGTRPQPFPSSGTPCLVEIPVSSGSLLQ